MLCNIAVCRRTFMETKAALSAQRERRVQSKEQTSCEPNLTNVIIIKKSVVLDCFGQPCAFTSS